MQKTIPTIFKNKLDTGLFLLFNIFIFISYLTYQNILNVIEVVSVEVFSFSDKLKIVGQIFFDLSSLESLSLKALYVLSSLSVSFFLLLNILLYKKSKEINTKHTFLAGIGFFFSVLGLSCVACGIGLLASLLSLFGLAHIISYFPFAGLEFGFLGIIVINLMNYILLKRLRNPFVC